MVNKWCDFATMSSLPLFRSFLLTYVRYFIYIISVVFYRSATIINDMNMTISAWSLQRTALYGSYTSGLTVCNTQIQLTIALCGLSINSWKLLPCCKKWSSSGSTFMAEIWTVSKPHLVFCANLQRVRSKRPLQCNHDAHRTVPGIPLKCIHFFYLHFKIRENGYRKNSQDKHYW